MLTYIQVKAEEKDENQIKIKEIRQLFVSKNQFVIRPNKENKDIVAGKDAYFWGNKTGGHTNTQCWYRVFLQVKTKYELPILSLNTMFIGKWGKEVGPPKLLFCLI